jgi:hypothetical protein
VKAPVTSSGATADAPPTETPPVFAELHPTIRTIGSKLSVDTSPSSPELGRFVFSIETAHGEKLGTAGPPPTADTGELATKAPTTTTKSPPIDESEAVADGKEVKPRKPVKPGKQVKPNKSSGKPDK